MSGRLPALAALLALAVPAGAETFHDGAPVMGTVLEITVVSDDAEAARAALDACFARARVLDALFTSWDPASPLSGLNRSAGGPPREVPPELARILADATALAARTSGAFDPTVGPLVRLWRAARRDGRLPEPSDLSAARGAVGFEGIAIDGGAVVLARHGMAVDLGGFAKGWALDRLGELLLARGIDRALLSFGQSSLLGLGAPEDAPAWRVLLRDPKGGFAGRVDLRDRSLSVSDSFGEAAWVEGHRLGHVIDPRSGRALDRRATAAILAESGAVAEAWSKAMLVLPAERGFALVARQEGVEAIVLEASGACHATRGRSLTC